MEYLSEPPRGHRQQVDAAKHYGASYLTLPRHVVHWHQANEVVKLLPKGSTVLEIGPGSGYTTFILRAWGMQVTTLDLDANLHPDIVGDVARLGVCNSAFDCVLAGQVLEHIPLDELSLALTELARITKRYVVITLPAPLIGFAGLFNIPMFSPIGIVFGLPYSAQHRFDGQHYWELGKRGSSIKTVRAKITQSGLSVIREFRPAPSLYVYFFVAERR